MVLGVQPPPLVHRPPQQASVGAKTRSATGASAHTSPAHTSGLTPALETPLRPRARPHSGPEARFATQTMFSGRLDQQREATEGRYLFGHVRRESGRPPGGGTTQ